MQKEKERKGRKDKKGYYSTQSTGKTNLSLTIIHLDISGLASNIPPVTFLKTPPDDK